jgi:hypothetical protein
VIKKWRKRWAKHVVLMERWEMTNAYRILVRKPKGKKKTICEM